MGPGGVEYCLREDILTRGFVGSPDGTFHLHPPLGAQNHLPASIWRREGILTRGLVGVRDGTFHLHPPLGAQNHLPGIIWRREGILIEGLVGVPMQPPTSIPPWELRTTCLLIYGDAEAFLLED